MRHMSNPGSCASPGARSHYHDIPDVSRDHYLENGNAKWSHPLLNTCVEPKWTSSMERSLLYTSRKTIPAESDQAEIAAIVAVARRHNAAVGITGGLINTDHAFAQLLEGSAKAIDDLMERIDRDPRHEDVQILRYDAITRRKLSGWSMAYSGSSIYLSKRIEPLLGGSLESDPRRIDSLIAMLVQFSTSEADTPPAERNNGSYDGSSTKS